jgi:hypothetical protein
MDARAGDFAVPSCHIVSEPVGPTRASAPASVVPGPWATAALGNE